MKAVSLSEMSIALDNTLSENLCVQAWLGNADVLFLGFGRELIPGKIIGKGASKIQQPRPPYQLQTELANWSIEHEIGLIGSSDDDKRAWAAVSALVGRKAVSWCLLNDISGLFIEFEGGLKLTVKPYVSAGDAEGDAWSLRDVSGYYLTVKCNGQVYKQHGSTPIR